MKLARLDLINEFLDKYSNKIDSWFVADINEIKRLVSEDYDDSYIRIKIENAQCKNHDDEFFIYPELEDFYNQLLDIE